MGWLRPGLEDNTAASVRKPLLVTVTRCDVDDRSVGWADDLSAEDGKDHTAVLMVRAELAGTCGPAAWSW